VSTTTTRLDDPTADEVDVIPRAEFLERFWDYRLGDHVTLIGPTGSGKTTLGYELLQRSSNPGLPGVVLVIKPRDATAKRWNDRLGYKIVRHWPPTDARKLWGKGTPGWTLWPKHSFNPEQDDVLLRAEMRRCILDSYRRGNRILFADEVVGLTEDLGLKSECRAVWMRGRSMGCGMWAATQRPFEAPLAAYSQSQHLFVHWDPDKRSRDRFKEIGGVDPGLITEIVDRLEQHQFLYFRRRDRGLAVVDK
jgi:hypothetical protein